MMRIILSDASKRFNRDWVFRHINYEFESGQSYAITGPNGSGKSTLLQVLSGALQLSEGNIGYEDHRWEMTDGSNPPSAISHPSSVAYEKVYKYISICAPYLEVVEEMTLKEFLQFHQNFKPSISSLSVIKIIEIMGLENAAHKQIRYFSSGMKQRVKLAQCILSDTPIVLLDEPCTNLDEAGIRLYNQLITEFCKKRMVIVSSNDHHEYEFCLEKINIMNWK